MKRSRSAVMSRSIKEAIDSYPGGLCFSTPAGKPILVNQQMNALISVITGHTVIEANSVWSELENFRSREDCKRLDRLWMHTDPADSDQGSLVFQLPDGKIWRFRRTQISGDQISTVQTEAAEITELYAMSEELYNNNIRLVNLRKRLETLLANIVQNNRDRELLKTKMRIHDVLGQCLIAAKQALKAEDMSDETYHKLLGEWDEAIRDMTNVPLQNVSRSPEAEMRKVADLVGCQLEFIGEQPSDRRTLLLLYSAIREALTNAVRHVRATKLTIQITRTEKGYHTLIFSNGNSDITELTERGGLASLRKVLEQEGASLNYQFDNGVIMVVDIPYAEGEKTV